MNTTIILTQILGIIFTVIGISLIMNRKNVSNLLEVMTQNTAIMWLGGFMALSFGAVIVSLNNVWIGSKVQIFITIVGWLAVLKGIFILFFPNTAVPFYRKANKTGLFVVIGIITLLLGLCLLYKGF